MNKDKSVYNESIAPLFLTRDGKGYTMGAIPVKKEMLEILSRVKEGGQFMVRVNKFKKSDKSPDAYLDYVTPERVRAYFESRTKVAEEV